MEQTRFNYSMKNIPIPSRSTYIKKLIENIGTQRVQELFFFVNKKPLEVANGAYQSIVKP